LLENLNDNFISEGHRQDTYVREQMLTVSGSKCIYITTEFNQVENLTYGATNHNLVTLHSHS